MLVYTSITKSYLPKARILAKSIKYFHPDWSFVLLYSDDLPVGFDLSQEPFDELLTIEKLNLPNWRSWAFGHSVVELCTAVKGAAAELLAQRPDVNEIMYLDPDVKVFNSLSSLAALLEQHDILLTPHLLTMEQDIDAIQDNEISALKHGVYNLGFFAARTSGQGLEFIRWWAQRLSLFCRDDIPGGLFTDQRWCDLAPAFFSELCIVRDPGCNVATWNVAHRPLSKDEAGLYYAANVPLRFYHFTGYDTGDGMGMLMRYAARQPIAHELWRTYREELIAHGQGNAAFDGWRYGQFDNDKPIPAEARRLYRSRPDIQTAFPDPYSVAEPCFLSWWKAEIEQGHLPAPKVGRIQQRKVSSLLARAVCSPREGLQTAKIAMAVLKSEGLQGLMRRLRNYSL